MLKNIFKTTIHYILRIDTKTLLLVWHAPQGVLETAVHKYSYKLQTASNLNFM